jgi:uncharacterized membrane protein/YHS domain-containing protein
MAVVGMWAIVLGFGSILAAADVPAAAAGSSATRPTDNESCPVMPKTKAEADLWLDYEGQRIYFCHKVCKTRFGRAPEKYLANLPAAMQQAIREHQRAAATSDQPTDTPEHPHDHMTDHPPASGPARSEIEGRGADADHHQGTSSLRRVGQFLGRFHPVAVHLPIGLLLAAALAEALFAWTHAEWLSGAARFSVLLGAAAGGGAASLGWLNAMSATYDGDLAQVLEYHRWLGTGTAALAVVVALLSEMHRRWPAPVWRLAYRLALLLAAAAVGLTGHLGGTLVYGVDYFQW